MIAMRPLKSAHPPKRRPAVGWWNDERTVEIIDDIPGLPVRGKPYRMVRCRCHVCPEKRIFETRLESLKYKYVKSCGCLRSISARGRVKHEDATTSGARAKTNGLHGAEAQPSEGVGRCAGSADALCDTTPNAPGGMPSLSSGNHDASVAGGHRVGEVMRVPAGACEPGEIREGDSMIVDGRVEVFHAGEWRPVELSKLRGEDGLPVVSIPSVPMPRKMSIAQAIEEGRAQWRWEQTWGHGLMPRPVRVVDVTGKEVKVWPKRSSNV